MKISRCPICKQPLTPGHKHSASEARDKFRKAASTKVRVAIPKRKA